MTYRSTVGQEVEMKLKWLNSGQLTCCRRLKQSFITHYGNPRSPFNLETRLPLQESVILTANFHRDEAAAFAFAKCELTRVCNFQRP